MMDVPADAMPVWVGVSIVSLVTLAVVFSFPSGTTQSANAVARTVDAVSVAPPGAVETHPVAAEKLKVGSTRIGLAGPNGATHASFAYGPIVPVEPSSALEGILDGKPARHLFEERTAFETAIRRSRSRTPSWRPAPASLTIRRVNWGDVDATLVG